MKIEREEDDRRIAEVPDLPGVMVYYQKKATSFGGGLCLPILFLFEGFAFYILLIWKKPPPFTERTLQVVFYWQTRKQAISSVEVLALRVLADRL